MIPDAGEGECGGVPGGPGGGWTAVGRGEEGKVAAAGVSPVGNRAAAVVGVLDVVRTALRGGAVEGDLHWR